MLLTDEEIQVMFKRTMGTVSDFHSFRFDFARAVEAAVLKRAVATVVKVFDHAFNMKVKGNRPSLRNVIDALEGRWKA